MQIAFPRVSDNWQKNKSQTVANENDEEIPKGYVYICMYIYIYIYPLYRYISFKIYIFRKKKNNFWLTEIEII